MNKEFEKATSHMNLNYKKIEGYGYDNLDTERLYMTFKLGFVHGEINQIQKNIDSIPVKQAS